MSGGVKKNYQTDKCRATVQTEKTTNDDSNYLGDQTSF